MLDRLLVPLPPLLLELDLHRALGVLDDRRLHADAFGRNGGRAAEGVVARPELVDGVEGEDVADLDVAQVGHGEEVPGREDVFLAD